MHWNLRGVSQRVGIRTPAELRRVFVADGFHPSPSKVAALWAGTPLTIRLTDLDSICVALNCSVQELLEPDVPGVPENVLSHTAIGDGSLRPPRRRAAAK